MRDRQSVPLLAHRPLDSCRQLSRDSHQLLTSSPLHYCRSSRTGRVGQCPKPRFSSSGRIQASGSLGTQSTSLTGGMVASAIDKGFDSSPRASFNASPQRRPDRFGTGPGSWRWRAGSDNRQEPTIPATPVVFGTYPQTSPFFCSCAYGSWGGAGPPSQRRRSPTTVLPASTT